MPTTFRLRIGACACLLALAACTTGPNFRTPDTPVPLASLASAPGVHASDGAAKAGETTPSRLVKRAVDPAWWALFKDPVLSALEREALDANLDLRAAATRLAQSRAALRVSGAALLPSVNANASGLRERASATGIMALGGTSEPISATAANGADPFGTATSENGPGSPPFSLWQAGFDASWELDLWGRARRMRESAAAELDAAHYDAQAVRVSVGAEVARTYLLLRGVQTALRIARDNTGIAEKSLHVAERRRQQGVATQLDTSLSASQLASFEAAIPELEHRQQALKNALALLLAKAPHALDAQLAGGGEVPALPAEVPVGLPSQLAQRRPDILRAEARLHAATAAIGAAKADFYPSVSLTGSFGFQSLSFSDVGAWDGRQFAFGPVLHLPIFDGGRLAGKLALSEARQQEAALHYQRTVLGAWHEVDDALGAYRAVQLRDARLAVALGQNRQALASAQRRYTQGAADYLNVLVTQQRLLDSENAVAKSRTEMALAMVALYKALGGGWDAAPAPAGRQP